jgi:hypothetical protein
MEINKKLYSVTLVSAALTLSLRERRGSRIPHH